MGIFKIFDYEENTRKIVKFGVLVPLVKNQFSKKNTILFKKFLKFKFF